MFNKFIAILSLGLLLFAGCAMNQPSNFGTNGDTDFGTTTDSQGLLGGIQPGPSGQLFPPRTNLSMGGHLFTNEGAGTTANQPCVYGQSNCNVEVVNNVYQVSTLPGGKAAGTQEVVTDWNGTAGACVGGGSSVTIALFNGSGWLCFGGSGGGGGPGQTQTTINGTGVSGGLGTITCNEYWITSNIKKGFCVGNAYFNPTGTPQTWTLPTTTASGIIPTFTANSTPFSTIAFSSGNVVISFPYNMGATWSGVISTSEFY